MAHTHLQHPRLARFLRSQFVADLSLFLALFAGMLVLFAADYIARNGA